MNKKEFIILIATTCVVIIAWIITDIIHTKASKPVSSSLQQALEPINPNFDQATLNEIKKLGNGIVTPIPNTTPTPTPKTTPKPTPISTSIPVSTSPSASVESL